jgi:hypothetical protein
MTSEKMMGPSMLHENAFHRSPVGTAESPSITKRLALNHTSIDVAAT